MPDVAHGDLALLHSRDVVGQGVARNDQLIPIENGIVVYAIAAFGLQVLISGLLDFRHSSRDGSALHENLEDVNSLSVE
jgi:hypothetical protein